MWSDIFILLSLFGIIGALQLPEYMTPCPRNDPKLDECALKSAKEAIKDFIKGDSSRNLKSLDPLYVPEIVVYIPDKNGLKIVFKENHFNGIKDTQVNKLHFNFKKKIINMDALLNSDVKNTYELSGKLLLLPISSSGNSSFKLKNTNLHVRMWYDHVTKDDGKVYWNITKHDVKYDMEKVIFKLENLLNDKNIGDQVNNLLNEMWREVVADVGPAICDALSLPAIDDINILLNQVPFDELFPE